MILEPCKVQSELKPGHVSINPAHKPRGGEHSMLYSPVSADISFFSG